MKNQPTNIKGDFRIKISFMSNKYSYWLISSNRREVKRFLKNDKSDDRFFDYMFIDTGEIIGLVGDKPPLMKTRVSVKIDEAREIYQRLLTQGWRKTKPVWQVIWFEKLTIFVYTFVLIFIIEIGNT